MDEIMNNSESMFRGLLEAARRHAPGKGDADALAIFLTTPRGRELYQTYADAVRVPVNGVAKSANSR